MSKELTEQWLKGNLADEGVYYWRISDGQELIKSQLAMFAYRLCSDAEKVECLAPVPSYDEYRELLDLNVYEKDRKKVMRLEDKVKRLQKKLEIATKSLKEYADITNWDDGVFMCVYDGTSFADEESAEQALKEIEEVK